MLYPSSPDRVFGLASPQKVSEGLPKGTRVGVLLQMLRQMKEGPRWQTYDIAYYGTVVDGPTEGALKLTTILPDDPLPESSAFNSAHPRQVSMREVPLTDPEYGPVFVRTLVAPIEPDVCP